MFLYHPLFQNVAICYFDRYVFVLQYPLLSLALLELLLQILLLIGLSPFPVILYYSRSNIFVGFISLEQVTVL